MLAFCRQCHAVASTPNDGAFIRPISLPPLVTVVFHLGDQTNFLGFLVVAVLRLFETFFIACSLSDDTIFERAKS